MQIDKTKLKNKLEKYLGRKAKPSELINAEKDQNILNELLLEEIEVLKTKVAILEEKSKIII